MASITCSESRARSNWSLEARQPLHLVYVLRPPPSTLNSRKTQNTRVHNVGYGLLRSYGIVEYAGRSTNYVNIAPAAYTPQGPPYVVLTESD
jgi:hypothetical protein